MVIVGWIIWSILLLTTLSWTMGIHQNYRRGKWFPNQIETVAVWYLLLAWTLFAPVSKLHLVWLASLAFALPMALWLWTISRMQRPALRLPIWLLVFGAILGLMTW